MMNTNISYLLSYVSYFEMAVNFTNADIEDMKTLSYLLSDDLNITNATADSTIIIVLMNNSKNQDVSLDVKKKIDEMKLTHVSVMQTSDAIVTEDLNSAANENNKILAGAAFLLISVVLFLSFRKISYVVISVTTLIIAIIWTVGTMVILGMTFTIMSVAVVPLMIGLGVDYSVHISKRYFEETKKHSIDGSVMISVKNTGKALSLALITTMIAFSSNSFSEITPVKEFGIICALGIFYAFAATFLFCLPVRYILDKKNKDKWRKSWNFQETKKVKYTVKTGLQQKIDVLEFKHKNSCKKLGISGIITKHKKTVALIIILLTIGAGFAARNIDSEYSVQDFLPSDWESMQTIERIEKEFSGASQLESYILIEGDVSNPQILDDMNKTLSNIADDKYAVKIDNRLRTGSVLKYIRYAVSENKTLAERFNFTSDGIPKQDADVRGMYDYLYDNASYGWRMGTVLHKTDNKYDATLIRVFVNSKTTEDARIMY
ncbi:MAG: MMPL family transporter, partial [Thermoplasmatales archaeon]|nr:MMPL family transporter [Thermoplasmatales archaeon]